MKYKFVTEDGVQELEYKDYLANPSLMEKIHDQSRKILILGNTIISYNRSYIKQNKSIEELVKYFESQIESNRLQFYCPGGESVRKFINDREHSITGLTAPNRIGKTAAGIIKLLTKIIQCDPEWPIFMDNGIKCQEFTEPMDVGIATYKWATLKRVVWPELRKWIPRSEIEDYFTTDSRGKKKTISWDRNPKLELGKSGSNIWFFCYEQAQDAFEGQALSGWLWDEQGEEDKFDGANERMRTGLREGFHIFSLTPHKIEGRPDTGAGSWIHKLFSGEVTKGHTVKFYKAGLDETKDWIYPKKQVDASYIQWVKEPSEFNDQKKLREGRARHYGEWHEASGLVYDEWDKSRHLIDPFEIPDNWTLYRSIDHGINNPTVCLWGAVNTSGDLFLYREYYGVGRLISENCKNIIGLSGNQIRLIGNTRNDRNNCTYERYEEIQSNETVYKTVMDSRSYEMPDAYSGFTISQMYRYSGISATPASGKKGEDTIPIVKEWFRVDFNKNHAITNQPGAPRIYVFRTLRNFISEMDHYVMEEYSSTKLGMEKNRKEKPRGKDDHGPDALRYMIQIPPRYLGNNTSRISDDDTVVNRRRVDSITGY